MLFNSDIFLFVFLPIVLIGYHALRRSSLSRAPFAWLVGSSFLFYGWWNPIYLLLLVGSILFNYVLSKQLGRAVRYRNLMLGLGVAFNLALLGYLKYTHFVIGNLGALAGFDWTLAAIILPLGISFFTFQQIAYLADVHGRKANLPNLMDYALFVSFFPQLIAGPIVHHAEMMPQFEKPISARRMNWSFALGITIFAFGLFKKVVIADTAALSAAPVFALAASGIPIGFAEAWQGALAYTAQIYFDFSAYSEMAIGLGLMFGIRLPVNFDSPYKSFSIIEFWRRWHMTLSRFLRDYVYFPLGGNRRGPNRRYANLMMVMLVGGLWHGAGWTFIVWGGLHGLYLLINHAWNGSRFNSAAPSRPFKLASWFLTFLAVVIAWVFFRADSFSAALLVLQGMAGLSAVPSSIFDSEGFTWVVLFLIISFVMPSTLAMLRYHGPTVRRVVYTSIVPKRLLTWRPHWQWVAATDIALVASIALMWSASEFLYFQF